MAIEADLASVDIQAHPGTRHHFTVLVVAAVGAADVIYAAPVLAIKRHQHFNLIGDNAEVRAEGTHLLGRGVCAKPAQRGQNVPRSLDLANPSLDAVRHARLGGNVAAHRMVKSRLERVADLV